MTDDKNDDKPEEFVFPEPSSGAGALPSNLPGQQLIQPNQNSIYAQDTTDIGEISESLDLNHAVESTALQYSSGLRSEKTLCETCIHCWSMRKEAVTMNLTPDGKPFMSREAFCTVNAQSLFTLNDRNVLECNKYEGGGKPRTTLEDL